MGPQAFASPPLQEGQQQYRSYQRYKRCQSNQESWLQSRQVKACLLLFLLLRQVLQHNVHPESWPFSARALKEEKGLIIRFGDDYKRYMKRVPGLNPLLGVMRLLSEKKE